MPIKADSDPTNSQLPSTFPAYWFGDWVTLRTSHRVGVIYGVELIGAAHPGTKRLGWWYRVLWRGDGWEASAIHEGNIIAARGDHA